MQQIPFTRPTHATLTHLVSSILPPRPTDVPLVYHAPRHPSYNPSNAVVERVVLGITPTPGVYKEIACPEDKSARMPEVVPHEQLFADSQEVCRVDTSRSPRTLCFLHRPFGLDRRRVRRGILVLSSHTSFDENLTVGWNTALAARLGIGPDFSAVQGYKGDPERRIGLVGKVSMLQGLLIRKIQQEFGSLEHVEAGASDEVHVVAIMNAFHAAEVYRVLEIAREHSWLASGTRSERNVLYLTGQPRESGMEAAKVTGMTVVCVGHRAAEEWGIRYLGGKIRSAFPLISVQEIFEPEVPRVRSNAQTDQEVK